MAKANRKAIDSGNFWDRHWVHGMYTARPKVNVKETKARQKTKKDRLRTEKHIINMMSNKGAWIRIHLGKTKCTRLIRLNQIQYGLDIATWWNEQHA